MLRSRLTRVFPQLLCRTISASRIADKGAGFSSISSSESSSAGESCSEAEDQEEGVPQVHQIQVLRAYLRNRRSRCLARVREQGLVPAVVINPDKERRPKDGSTDVFISLDAKPLVSILKFIGKRDFVSRVFDMEIYRGPSSSQLHERLQVLPRNLNYGPGKTNILNIQFIRALPGQDLLLGVPLEFLGMERCPGLKKGGTLKKLAKYAVYCCKASELPAKIVVDMTVLEIGDRVLLQDLEVDFDHLHSDRTMPVCEIVKDVSSLKAKARKLKTELHFKRKAHAAKESSDQSQALTDDEVEISDEEEEVVPYRYQKQRLAQKEASTKKASARVSSAEADEETSGRGRARSERDKGKPLKKVEVKQGVKPSKRRLTGAAFVKGKLNEQVESRNASLSVKTHNAAKVSVSEDDDDNALVSFMKKQATAKDRFSEGLHGQKVPREQQGVALGLKKRKVYHDVEVEDDDEVESTSYSSKATAKRRPSEFKVSSVQRNLSSSLTTSKVFSDSDSEDGGEALPRYTKERTQRVKTHKRALGA